MGPGVQIRISHTRIMLKHSNFRTEEENTCRNLDITLFVDGHFFQDAYDEAKKGFEVTGNTKEKGVMLTKEERAHGSLIIINELIRSASVEGEVLYIAVNTRSGEWEG